MSLPQTTTKEQADLGAVADALRSHDRFLVTTHENPDGDALGSLLATTVALRQLGKDVLMFLSGDAPLPREYAFMHLDGLLRELPADIGERVLVAVDCAKADRIGADPAPVERAKLVLDIDHHHDNTRFGAVNLIVADASSTGEVLRDVFRELGVELTPEIAEPLYIALVTDTGRFQYANTSPKSLRLAAELVDELAHPHTALDGRIVLEGQLRSSFEPELARELRLQRAVRRLQPAHRGLLLLLRAEHAHEDDGMPEVGCGIDARDGHEPDPRVLQLEQGLGQNLPYRLVHASHPFAHRPYSSE